MSAQWKRGDLVLGRYGRMLYTERFHENGEAGWLFASDGSFIEVDAEEDHHALLVIDAEDMTQIERLFAAFRGKLGMRSIQNGLRELLDTSNKPDEPQNIGAVVVDALGRRYVRGATKCCSGHWTQAAMDHFIDWSAFDAVRVLSTGVEEAGDE